MELDSYVAKSEKFEKIHFHQPMNTNLLIVSTKQATSQGEISHLSKSTNQGSGQMLVLF